MNEHEYLMYCLGAATALSTYVAIDVVLRTRWWERLRRRWRRWR